MVLCQLASSMPNGYTNANDDDRQCYAIQYQGLVGGRSVRGKSFLLDTNALSNLGFPINTKATSLDASPPSWSSNRTEFVVVTASDADDDRCRQASQVGHVMGDEGLDAVVIQTNGVEQSCRGLDRSPRGVSSARLLGDRFRENTAELAEIDERCHLAGIAEGARGGEDRIAELQSSELDS